MHIKLKYPQNFHDELIVLWMVVDDAAVQVFIPSHAYDWRQRHNKLS